MSGIHDAVTTRLQSILQAALITNIDPSDDARAGVVKIGPLLGEPEPDTARISVTIHENDPDNLDSNEEYFDRAIMVEIGGAVTHARRFVIKIRCLFETTQETLAEARTIASTVIERVEKALIREQFTGVVSGNEYVSRGALANGIESSMRQSGGPPDAFDFYGKIRFDILTTRTGVFE